MEYNTGSIWDLIQEVSLSTVSKVPQYNLVCMCLVAKHQSILKTKYGDLIIFPINLHKSLLKYSSSVIYPLPQNASGWSLGCRENVGVYTIIPWNMECLISFHIVPVGSLFFLAFFPNNLGINKNQTILRWIVSWGGRDKPGLLIYPWNPDGWQSPQPQQYSCEWVVWRRLYLLCQQVPPG